MQTVAADVHNGDVKSDQDEEEARSVKHDRRVSKEIGRDDLARACGLKFVAESENRDHCEE